MRKLPVKIKKVTSHKPPVTRNLLLLFISYCLLTASSYAAPCYGTNLPKKKQFHAGLQTYSIFKRYLENGEGKIRSTQHFLLLSYGLFDWLAIDLKGGAGSIKQRPTDSEEIDYTSNFAGGYGYRIKFYDKNNWRLVFGFQHISVHPKSRHRQDIKHQSILDDWQYSLLVSKEIFKTTPYIGTRWSRVDYIHKNNGVRKRAMSDRTKSIGAIVGIDLPVSKNAWFNLEGQFQDSEAVSFSLNYSF